jgi:BirA family transcriptional regulator, biotin operon repressor / biotin---[acetyl-CoA-carboxylase] ligase
MSLAERVLLERLRRLLPDGCRFSDVRWLAETDSTNRVVADEARSGAAEGLVVVAEFQTAGRGRLDRRWEAPAGSALLLSLLLRPVDLPLGRRHLVTAATGLAAREACAAVGLPFPDLKWPNDLLVGERKLGGILAQADADAVVVGIGINVSAAPPGAVCADEVAAKPVGRAELAAALLASLDRRLGRWDDVAAEYGRSCATVGRRVRLETAGGDVVGLAEGVDDAGRLVVRGSSGRRVFSVGDVVHLRPG